MRVAAAAELATVPAEKVEDAFEGDEAGHSPASLLPNS